LPDPYFVGGVGTALGQVFRRNFPSQSGGAFLSASVRNRQAQADYGIDQLTLRTTQLQDQKNLNQVTVDVSNYVTALRQARARYEAAVKSRVLEEQLLSAEQKKFALGASTPFNVVQQQRDLATAQSTEVSALVAYSNAQVALQQALGTILDEHNISLQEAMSGRVARQSSLPETLPKQP
jgi:outer membrane protein TolC